MKILAILGSARKGGNTHTLIKEALKGAGAAKGTKVYDLSRMDIHGCMGCLGCRVDGSDGCILKDEMQVLYKAIKDADAIILGSPIYYGEVTGQMKTFMDRWYALRDHNRNLRLAEGKKALFILTQGAEGADRYSSVAERLTRVLESYKMKTAIVVFPGLEKNGAAKKDEKALGKALKAGAGLID